MNRPNIKICIVSESSFQVLTGTQPKNHTKKY